MGKEELVACFQDTLEKSYCDSLRQRTQRSVKSNRIYKEGFVSNAKHRSWHTSIDVCAGTTFDIARKYRSSGKIAVLNFANPEHPGGGVQLGAMAQEECLCRSSNLFACINDPNIFEDYYGYHRRLKSRFYSDCLIYTKDVSVFKDDSIVPQMMPEAEWFAVDVITCAAPYLAKRRYTNTAALLALLKKRVKNIFEAARDNSVDCLILGAFGCGAFKNPPLVVAEAFLQTIEEQHYMRDFKIVFAIKPTCEYCPNLSAFRRQFDEYAADAGERTMILPDSLEFRFWRNPKLPTEQRFSSDDQFRTWQRGNRYFGKQFSVLGDSISTLDGYNPRGYKVFYAGENCARSGVIEAADTWWDKVIAFFGGELLVNNSWSGSRVTKVKEYERLFPSSCSDERTSALHINDVMPDVILVYLGTNDWAFGAKTGSDSRILGEDSNELFNEAYDRMLKKLKTNYPESEIWCCTLCETFISACPDFKFPHKYAGTHIEEYNEIIRRVVRHHNCKLVDLYDYKMAYDSIDGSHPTNTGMNTIATMMIRSIVGSDADRFLDCEDGQHEYEMCGRDGHGDYYRCRKCGKEKFVCPWEALMVEQDKNINNESEYVMLDPNITTVLYSTILRLTIESTGKVVQFQKDVVEVGRDKICDLLLKGKPTVAHRQATFFCEKNMWFLRDNFSTNGTWLNGVKIQPGKKYQLATNDEINFAMTERVIFDKREQNAQPTGDPDAKALAFLEAGMSTFAKSEHKDEAAFKLIVAALLDAPLYFPVEIDLEAMLGSVDYAKLKAGDTLQPTKDVKMRILTLELENDMEFVPMFTSNDEANKGPSASLIRFHPQDYLPKLVQMDKPVIVNPFSENRFIFDKQLITEVLLPLVQNNKEPQTAPEQQTETQQNKYIGQIIDGKYEILKLIGRGGFHTTYLAKDIRLDKIWAVKVCDKQDRSYSPVLRDSILVETYMMMKLDHPAIPRIVDIIEDENSIFVARDYIEGETLETLIKRSGPQPVDKVVNWGKQLCNVLEYLHSQEPPCIYRDVKPANMILRPDNTVALIDFGIARTYKPGQREDTVILGTRGYAAPEQFGGSQTDARTDIFGLGMTMFRLVTGINPTEPPYEVKPIRLVNPNLPQGLEYIISKCTQPNPEERYQTCDDLMDDMNNYLNLPKPKGFFGKLFGKK